MKILKRLIVGLTLLIICNASKADVPVKLGNFTLNHAINSYIDFATRNRIHDMGAVVDASAKFTILSQAGILSFNKDEMMDYAKSEGNIEFNCTTSTTILQNNDDVAVVKIDMQFPSFVRTDYVTIANTKNGWKITNAYSVFK